MAATELQHTLAKSDGLTGTALHTGEKVTLRLLPAPVDHGIKFKRKDLADEPTIDANIANLKTVERATTIGEGAVRVHTGEHVLSALSAMGVDNAIVEMDANEPPIGDGSAQPYVDVIKRAGVTPRKRRENFSTCANRYMSNRRRGRSSSCCQTRIFASHARRPDRTIGSRSSSRRKSPRRSSSAKSRRRGRLFITKTCAHSWTKI